MTYHLSISNRARRDVREIFDWIAERSPRGAESWYSAYCEVIHSLNQNPEAHGEAPESNEVVENVRQVFFKTKRGRLFRVLFYIVSDSVYVLAIRGPDQRLLTAAEISEAFDD